MRKILKHGDLLAIIDAAATRAANMACSRPVCTCNGCENYSAALPHMDSAFKNFVASLGLDARNPSEIGYPAALEKEKGPCVYWGFFHMSGQLYNAHDRKENVQDAVDLDKPLSFAMGYGVGLSRHVDLLEAGFPAPVVQLEFAVTLPWVLPEAVPDG